MFLEENIKKIDRLQLQKILDASPQVKSTEFVSKEDAAKILESDLGEDFISLSWALTHYLHLLMST